MQTIHQINHMGIHNCSTSDTTFIFPPPSQEAPLIMHHLCPSSGWNHTSTNTPDLCPSSWTTVLPERVHFNRILPPPSSPPSSQSSHGGFFKSVVDGLQYAYEGSTSTTSPSTENQLGFQPGSDPFGIQPHETRNNKIMSAREMVDAKAVAASKSHSEAERRRRERINNHLTKLRSLLPNTTKTDKASLLAEVIQHVKELKRQTSIIAEQGQVPTEINEVIIDKTSDADGRVVIRASLCCEDRSDLLPDLIKTLKMLRLRTLKAEITTLGRRVKNVLFVTGEEDHYISNGDTQMVNQWVSVIEEALKAVVKKTDDGDDSSFGSGKRQRTNNDINIFGHRRSL